MAKIDDFLVRYPFLPRAREVLAELPPDDRALPRPEIIDQARYRIERAARNAELDFQKVRGWPLYREFEERTERTDVPNNIVEFYSFFVAVQASSKDSFLMTAFGRSEAQRSKTFYYKEKLEDMVAILSEATPLVMNRRSEDAYDIPVESYLTFASGHDLFGVPKWKLVNLPLESGVIHFSRNRVMDLFASIVNSLMTSGMKALRTQPVRADVMMLVRQLEPLIPRREPTSRANYDYVERVLKHKVSDGRHRLSWLVLAPYLVNIKGLDEDTAIEIILEYIGDSRYRQFVRYQVKRTARQGLLPPSSSTLKAKHSDLYAIIEREVMGSD